MDAALLAAPTDARAHYWRGRALYAIGRTAAVSGERIERGIEALRQ